MFDVPFHVHYSFIVQYGYSMVEHRHKIKLCRKVIAEKNKLGCCRQSNEIWGEKRIGYVRAFSPKNKSKNYLQVEELIMKIKQKSMIKVRQSNEIRNKETKL